MREKMLAVVKIVLCSGLAGVALLSLGAQGWEAGVLFCFCVYAYAHMLWPGGLR